MFERFTEKAIKVIMLAQEESRRLGHNFVGTEQILLGLIGEGTGIAAKTLKSMGVNLKDARIETEKIIGRGSGFVSVEIPFTPRAKRLLEHGWDEARQLGHNYIATEHLLLGLIREKEGVAYKVLENLGINVPLIRTEVIKKLGEGASDSIVASSSGTPSDIKPKSRSYFYDAQKTVNPKAAEFVMPGLDKLTDGVIKVILIAREECRRLGHNPLNPEHILLGLISEGSGITGKLFQSLGIEIDKARNLVEHTSGKGPWIKADYIAFSPATIQIFSLAKIQAHQLGLMYIKKEHLLLIMPDDFATDTSLAAILQGTSPVKLKAELTKLMNEQHIED